MSEHKEATEKPEQTETPEPLEQAEQPEQPEHHEHHPAKQSSGSSWPFVGTLLALIALFALFLLWQKQQSMNADTKALQQSVSKLLTVVDQRHQQQMQQLSQLENHQHSATEAEVQRLATQVQDLYNHFAQGEQGWFLAEMEYLLRTASHHLSLDRDKKTALNALQQARQRMAAKDPDIYQPVIQQIDKDIVRINAISMPDRNQIAAEIGKLLAESETWPFAVSTNLVGEAPPPAASESGQESAQPDQGRLSRLLERIWTDLKGLVTIRRNGDVAQPLLQPQQRYFLLQNLQLKLQAARLALHAGNDIAFRDSLVEAEEWLKRYFDTSSLSVSEAEATVKQLATIDLTPGLPTLGDNIALLHRVAPQILPPVSTPQPVSPPPARQQPAKKQNGEKPAKAPPSSAQQPTEPPVSETQEKPDSKPVEKPQQDADNKPAVEAQPADLPDQPTGDAQ